MSIEAPELCDIKWIAGYLEKSRSTVTNRIIHMPGFPEPVKGCERPLKFVKRDVIAFLTHSTQAA